MDIHFDFEGTVNVTLTSHLVCLGRLFVEVQS